LSTALLVERGKQAGYLEEVAAQLVRLGGVRDLGDDRAEAEQLEREVTLAAR